MDLFRNGLEGMTTQALLEGMIEGVYVTDLDRRILFWSRSAERITGFAARDVVGSRCSDNILQHVDHRGACLCLGHCPLARSIDDGQVRESHIFLHHREGHRVPVHVRTLPLRADDGRIVGGIEIFLDETPSVAAQERIDWLKRMTLLDPLTGLLNRRGIHAQLETRLEELNRFGWSFGVLFLDLDRFKTLNDTHGHPSGDRVLSMVGRTLRHNLRILDAVGRWGGEEFLVLLANVSQDEMISKADGLRSLIEASSTTFEGHELRCTASVGATLARPDDTLEGLVDRADRLMYAAKEAGRNRIASM